MCVCVCVFYILLYIIDTVSVDFIYSMCHKEHTPMDKREKLMHTYISCKNVSFIPPMYSKTTVYST